MYNSIVSKKSTYYNLKNTFLLKQNAYHDVSLQQFGIFLLVEGHYQWLLTDLVRWWLLNVEVAVAFS